MPPSRESKNSLALFLSLLLLIGIAFAISKIIYFGPKKPDLPYEVLWSSDLPSKMKQVAEAAVYYRDDEAELLIIKEAISGKPRKHVWTSLIRTALDAKWEASLDDEDRRTILAISLSEILGGVAGDIDLSKTHPAVIFSVVGSTALTSSDYLFAGISLERLSTLPNPIGKAFQDLSKLKIANLGNRRARALARMALGDSDPETVHIYFEDDRDPLTVLANLRIVAPFLGEYPKLADEVFTYLTTENRVLGANFRWFSIESGTSWAKVTRYQILSLVAGLIPATELSFDQYADLLSYPSEDIRKKAAALISFKFGEIKEDGALNFLASEENSLTRPQLVLLVSTLQLPNAQRFPFISGWLKTEPDSNSLIALLVARKRAGTKDVFNLEVSRYLARISPKISDEKLEILASHPEELARALAISRLDPNNARHRTILKTLSEEETVARLRQEILDKLSLSEKL